MSIRFSCSCGRKLKVSDEKIGMKVLCSSCGATLKVPKKSQDQYWQEGPAKSDEAKVDYVGISRDFLIQFLPGAVVVGLMVWFAYYLSMQMVVGRGNLPDLGRVHGKVTLEGAPLPGATVRFLAIDPATGKERKGASVGLGTTDQNGNYVLYYVKETQGAAVGLNRVEIEGKDQNGNEMVRADFNVRSTLKRDVKSGSNSGEDFDFDVKSVRTPMPEAAAQPAAS
jgi:hypothetical protein